jgi:asparagine synthase (glutamine-hydrolysing)
MCGLAGIWSYRGADAADLEGRVQAMADTLAHRGPDDAGSWVDAQAGIALGFRRLAILDLSPAGHQPMQSADGRYVVVFNGEIYNFRELRRELDKEGVRFRGRSDTEVIVEGATVWGVPRLIAKLWGMFALALWDRHERVLVLARDRLGKKPLFYGEAPGCFLFGSELKALRAIPQFQPRLDRDSAALFLRLGYVPSPRSIYAGVWKLPPGTWAEVRAGQSPVITRYWDARDIAERAQTSRLTLGEEEAVGELDTLLRDAVERRMIADVPLGAFLSGGIDSSTVVALMQAQSTTRVKTFTIGFHAAGYDEAKDAARVAGHLGTEHTELYLSPEEAWEVIPRLPCLYDEPLADPSQIPTLLVSALARRHVTVALSGDGGDELFAGYRRYADAEQKWSRLRRMPGPARRLAARVARTMAQGGWDSRLEQVGWAIPERWPRGLEGYRLELVADLLDAGPDRVYDHVISIWRSPADVVIGAQDGPSGSGAVVDARVVPGFLERMMLKDLMFYLPDDILVKVDRASMAVGLEARAPLLDHRVVEWVWRLPLSLKRRSGQPKWLLRQVLYRYVPAPLVDRPKMGFGVPIDSWLRGPLRDWAEDLLDERAMTRAGILDSRRVRRIWHRHLRGEPYQEYRLWAVLSLQAWLMHYRLT